MITLTKEEQKAAALEKHKAQEANHKIVMKIISWKAGPLEGAAIHKDNKITKEEWETYTKHVYNTYKEEGKDKAKKKLEEAHAAISKNGGFA